MSPEEKKGSGRTTTHVDGDPVYLKRLADKMGASEAASAIGISSGHLHAVVSGRDPCRLAFNLAAKAVLMQMNSEQFKVEYMVVRVPREKKELLVTFLKGLELKFSFWDIGGA